ncbi:MAG: hypothetical protein N4A44_02900 [Alphaproteobacteria bacterium]|jgi:acetyltransferase-like isoleucine patch superfamily enzyme|nr:hypothetical protein [Alphaproteobacteria bacterium]
MNNEKTSHLKTILDAYNLKEKIGDKKLSSSDVDKLKTMRSVYFFLELIEKDGFKALNTDELLQLEWVRSKMSLTWTGIGSFAKVMDPKPWHDFLAKPELIKNFIEFKNVRFLGVPSFFARGCYFREEEGKLTTVVAGAFLDIFLDIAAGATIQAMAKVGACCKIGAGANIGKFVDIVDSTLSNRTEIGEKTILDSYVRVGAGTKILNNTIIRERTSIGNNSTIGENCIIGKNVTIGNNVTVVADQNIPDGTIILDNKTYVK